jgi:hypothetical protein
MKFTKKEKVLFEKQLKEIGLPYFNKKQIRWDDFDHFIITFCLPRDSLFLLCEWCKLNNIIISYHKGEIELFIIKIDAYKDDYWIDLNKKYGKKK